MVGLNTNTIILSTNKLSFHYALGLTFRALQLYLLQVNIQQSVEVLIAAVDCDNTLQTSDFVVVTKSVQTLHKYAALHKAPHCNTNAQRNVAQRICE